MASIDGNGAINYTNITFVGRGLQRLVSNFAAGGAGVARELFKRKLPDQDGAQGVISSSSGDAGLSGPDTFARSGRSGLIPR